MDITNDLLEQLSAYTCPVHGDNTHFKIEPLEGKVVTYCCELCKEQVEDIIAAQ